MTENIDTIDTKVESESLFFRNLWNKGKYALAIIGAAYVINSSYHLVNAIIKDVMFKELQTEAEIEVLKLMATSDGMREAGMSSNAVNQRFSAKLNELYASDRRGKVIEQRNYHLWKALNPLR